MGLDLAEAAKKLTYEDYCRIPDDGKRREVVDGVVYVSPAPTTFHQQVIVRLLYALQTYMRETQAGLVMVAPLDVLLDDHDIVQPDLLVVLAERFGRMKKNGCHGAPDLAIEVLSPSNPEHDVIRKRRLYERTGVREYWVADPRTSRIDVYRRIDEAHFGRPLVLFADRDESIDTPLLPGFTARLAEIFDPGPLAHLAE